MKTAALITARRGDVDVEAKIYAVKDGAVAFDVPANGRPHPHVVLSLDVAELREALDVLAPSDALAGLFRPTTDREPETADGAGQRLAAPGRAP